MTRQILLQLVYKMKKESEHTCLLYHPTPNSSNFTFSQVRIIRHIMRHITTRTFLDSFAVIPMALCLVVNFPFCLFNDWRICTSLLYVKCMWLWTVSVMLFLLCICRRTGRLLSRQIEADQLDRVRVDWRRSEEGLGTEQWRWGHRLRQVWPLEPITKRVWPLLS